MNRETYATLPESDERHEFNGREPLPIYLPPNPPARKKPTGQIPPARKEFHFGLSTKIIAPTVIVILASFIAIYATVQHEAKRLEVTQLTALASGARSVQDKIDRCLFERYGDVQAFGLNRELHRNLSNLTDT